MNLKILVILTRLVETVDKLWHQLENEYPDILPSVEGVKDFNKHIKGILSGSNKNKIAEFANKIRTDLLTGTKTREYRPEDFDAILEYLKSKVP